MVISIAEMALSTPTRRPKATIRISIPLAFGKGHWRLGHPMERTTPSAFYQRPPAMLVLDVDGVLTDNAIIFDADGREAK